MGTLLLIRHGRTDANATGVLAGRTPGVALDEVGRTSTQALAKRLEGVNIARVVSSPLERTRETAQILFQDRQDVEIEDRLLECDYGDWQGAKLSELAVNELWPIVQQRPDEMIFPNGESMNEMSSRASTAAREWDAKLTSEHGDKVVWVAVSHGDIIKAICADAMGLPLRKFQSLLIEPASVSVIHYSESGSAVSKLNDTGSEWLTKLNEEAIKTPMLGGESGKD
ncbi:MAG: MSMEG_4193 family putative phosphomutase [Candidatus Nanopelagicales bacterium]|nr:MSMEG_4193 family putative phosphomutase [Candidatus Nanopelagicales bacterium]